MRIRRGVCPVFVEILIRAPLDDVWERSQHPGSHQRWDLRFTGIDYLPREEGDLQRFRYVTRLLPGLAIAGTGVTSAERHRDDGSSTSGLRFFSPSPLSLIKSGAGYWQYAPQADGTCFRTGYDYQPRWGVLGRAIDHAFRPVMGWATAWSFDRLRLWLERGTTPERALRQAVTELLVRTTVIAAALAVSSLLAVATAVVVSAVPPLPGTPAARRCRRRPRDRRAAPPPVPSLLELP